MKRNLDIIWNLSLACPWDCEICCVDAVHVTSIKGKFKIKSKNLEMEHIVDRSKQSIFDQATQIRQKQGLELTLNEKLSVLDNLLGHDVKFNFSGGDPLVVSENLEVIKKAAELFGKSNIQISTTGAGLSIYKPEELTSFINKLKFSYDTSEGILNPNRPRGYNNINLLRAGNCSKAGLLTMAETPLSVRNIHPHIIKLLYENMHKAEIDQVLLMRLFPVGRGIAKTKEIPTKEQYMKAIETFRILESKHESPKIKLQCALQHLYPDYTTNPCDLYRESLAINPNGLLITSAWALTYNAKPIDDAFILGNIAKDSLRNLLDSQKAKEYQNRVNENFGHCKIFSYLNSHKKNAIDRIFDNTDPLFTSMEA